MPQPWVRPISAAVMPFMTQAMKPPPIVPLTVPTPSAEGETPPPAKNLSAAAAPRRSHHKIKRASP